MPVLSHACWVLPASDSQANHVWSCNLMSGIADIRKFLFGEQVRFSVCLPDLDECQCRGTSVKLSRGPNDCCSEMVHGWKSHSTSTTRGFGSCGTSLVRVRGQGVSAVTDMAADGRQGIVVQGPANHYKQAPLVFPCLTLGPEQAGSMQHVHAVTLVGCLAEVRAAQGSRGHILHYACMRMYC